MVISCKSSVSDSKIIGDFTCTNVGSGYPDNYSFKADKVEVNSKVLDVSYPSDTTVKIDSIVYTIKKNGSDFSLQGDPNQQSPDDLNCGKQLSKDELRKKQEEIQKQLQDGM